MTNNTDSLARLETQLTEASDDLVLVLVNTAAASVQAVAGGSTSLVNDTSAVLNLAVAEAARRGLRRG